MKEIKFRAWDGRNFIIPDGIIMSYTGRTYCIFIDGFDNIVEEIELPVMQYTGIKDKNGKEIYEGDIIQYSIQGYVQAIYYEVKDMQDIRLQMNRDDNYYRRDDDIVVVGNIYETDLLTNK